MVNKTTTPALTQRNIAAKARAYLAEARKDNLRVLNFSGYIVIAAETVKTEIVTAARIRELFCANKTAYRIMETKAEKSARMIELTPFSSDFMSVKNVMDKAIRATIITAKVPKTPTEAKNSNKAPAALSKRMFHKGEPLKDRERKREKS